MTIHDNHTPKTKSRTVARHLSEGQSNSMALSQLAHNSSGNIAGISLQEMADNSSRVKQLKAIQVMANNYTSATVTQRVVDNSLPVQLRKYKDSELRKMVKDAANEGLANKTAILLAIYNQMRFEVDPTPALFTSVVTARAAMITAGRLEEEDADALDTEATKMQSAGGDPVVALRTRIAAELAAKRGAIDAKYGHHVFKGDTNATGDPTGYHSIADTSTTHVGYGAKTDLGNGVYQQSVRLIGGASKAIQSTFFPDAANRAQVIDAITAVYALNMGSVANVHPNVNGLRLEKRGGTVFPAGGSDARRAEALPA